MSRMTYPDFQRLLELNLRLGRQIHRAPPEDRRRLQKTVEEIRRQLHDCELYDHYLRRYAETSRLIG